MRTVLSFISIIILAILAQIFLPWWSVVLVCFLVGLAINDNAWGAFFTGFLSIAGLWLGFATYISFANDFILIDRMIELLPVPNSLILILATGLVGGLLGAFSTLSGYFLQTINQKPKRRVNKYA